MFKFEKAMKAAGIACFVLLFCFHTLAGAETDFESTERLAEQGDADAQLYLGLMYHAGQRVPENYTEAIKWYKKAAEQGNATAQAMLGHLYNEGKGVSQNYAEAFKWFKKAAEQGDASAQRAAPWGRGTRRPCE